MDEAIKSRNLILPDKLYKYRSISDTTIDMLNDDSVWLTSPFNFNDPYDSSLCFLQDEIGKDLLKMNIEGYIENAQLEKWFDEVEIQELKKADNISEEIKKLVFIKYPNTRFDNFNDVLDEMIKERDQERLIGMNKAVKNSIKLTCFSESNNSILMWSHYADSHKGICIEYNVSYLSIQTSEKD